jgi:hypothetical protein
MFHIPNDKDVELWKWSQSERRRLKVTAKQFLRMIGLDVKTDKYIMLIYFRDTPPSRNHHPELYERLEFFQGRDLTGQLEEELKINGPTPLIDRIQDVFYSNHGWMKSDAHINELMFGTFLIKDLLLGEEPKEVIECLILLDDVNNVDAERSKTLLFDKLKEHDVDISNHRISFKVAKTKNL